MDKDYREAFAEVLEVIKNSNDNIKKRIPQKFIAFLEKNKDDNYIVKIDFNNVNWDDSLKSETLAVLALIYRDYIISQEERKKLLIEEQEELIKIENELREKYNPDNVFVNRNQKLENEQDINTNETKMIEYSESIFTKIKKWLKNLFNK